MSALYYQPSDELLIVIATFVLRFWSSSGPWFCYVDRFAARPWVCELKSFKRPMQWMQALPTWDERQEQRR
ncbi:hypothetical protein QR685DRAFT_594914 [Neurospora intermedia]|uniref:Uncharacterized protein n=1 Tax=Neurospora intermedia TaxID=5142 RepID=A0ABR3DKD2_NEUIN